MPIPWGVILANIPWSKVIDNAPKLLDGTQKLFNRLKKQQPPPDIEPSDLIGDPETAPLEHLIQENRRELRALHRDVQETAILLHHLTEQNTKTVAEVETLRRRTARLQRVLVVMALVVVGLLVHACTR